MVPALLVEALFGPADPGLGAALACRLIWGGASEAKRLLVASERCGEVAVLAGVSISACEGLPCVRMVPQGAGAFPRAWGGVSGTELVGREPSRKFHGRLADP